MDETGRASGEPDGFGTRLRVARRLARLSQRELAERAGVSVRTIRDLESGRVRRPRAESVRRLARVLRLDSPREPVAAHQDRADGDRLDIGVLGPLRVSRGGRLVAEGSVKQRSLLGVLALQPGQVVGHEELIDILWGERPPATCRNLVHTYVARLRRLLEPARSPAHVIVGVNGGYRLMPDGIGLDLLRFDDLVDQSRKARDDQAAALRLLDRALRCWRGPVLADLTARLRQHPAAVAAGRRRLTAVLAHADLALELGMHEQAVEHLQPVTHEEPLHESLHARLMLALAGSGQQAAALAIFPRMRDRLIEELGVEPGTQLRDAHTRILSDEIRSGKAALTAAAPAVPEAPLVPAALGPAPPSLPRAPAQLPADVPGFTGRAGHLKDLDDLAGGPAGTAMKIMAITGMAGVGKTALAVHWAHRVAGRFADGQLYVNLRGHADGPAVEPLQALAALLGGLGVAADKVPVELEQAAALYRSVLTGKRMIVVLDNARSAEQVRPLLPGHPGCVVVVTSRDRLTALVATHGAHLLPLDLLPLDEAAVLLTRMLGEERVAAERRAAGELARLCGRLPLALRIAAATLIGEPGQSLTGHVAALRSRDLLSGLALEGDPVAAVRLAFDHSYRLLSPPARRLFRLLGPAPGPDLGVPAAAALAEVTVERAERLVRELVAAHLAEPRPPGRIGLHDLLRLYARERSEGEDDAGDREAAVRRLLTWYLHGADEAARVLYPLKVRLPVRPPDGRPRTLHDPRQAMQWLETERVCLRAAVQHAAEHGPRPLAWLLADTLRGYYWLRRHKVDWLAVAQAGISAAADAGDVRAQAAGLLSLCHAHAALGRYRQAIGPGTEALDLARRAGWEDGEAEALSELGLTNWWLGDLRRAADHLTRSRELSRRTGRPGGEGTALLHLGVVVRHLGDLRRAADHQRRALSLFRELGSRNGEDQALGNLGVTYHHLGRLDDARDCLTRALALCEETGNRFGHAYILASLAAVHHDLGRLGEAEKAAGTALGLAHEIGHRYIESHCLSVLGNIRLRLGDHRQALAHHRQALDLAREASAGSPQTEALLGLAATHQQVGRPGEALDHARQALALAEHDSMRVLEGLAHAAAAAAHQALGEHDRALRFAERALTLHRQTGHRLGEARVLELTGHVVRDREGAQRAMPYWTDALDLYIAIGAPEAAGLRALMSG